MDPKADDESGGDQGIKKEMRMRLIQIGGEGKCWGAGL